MLGQQLAQAQVDQAFANARINAIRQAIQMLWSVARPIDPGCDCMPPTGYIIPSDALISLQSLMG